MSLYQAYINSIQSMLLETTDIKQLKFKSDGSYRQILEHCSADHGRSFYNLIKEEFPRAEILKFTNLNDMYGNPEKSQIFDLFVSPASILYVYHAHLILKHLNEIDKNEVDILEVGGGYGGLCLALHIYAADFKIKIKSYSIVDLQEPLKLQQLYLNAHKIRADFLDAYTYGEDAKTNLYFISVYAISEFGKEVFDKYTEILIPKCAHGFILWNYMNHSLPTDLLNPCKFNIKYEDERPQTSRHNQFITFSRTSNLDPNSTTLDVHSSKIRGVIHAGSFDKTSIFDFHQFNEIFIECNSNDSNARETLDVCLKEKDLLRYNFLNIAAPNELKILKSATQTLPYIHFISFAREIGDEVRDFLSQAGFKFDTNIYVKDRYVKNLVSVVIPTYERFDNVKIAIESVLSQTYEPLELIVVNDCSTDERYQTLNELFPTVTFLHLPFNIKQKYGYDASQGETRAHGAAISRGEFLAFLDDDDAYCDKQKIEMQVNLMRKYPDHKLCSSEMVNGRGKFGEVMTGTLHYKLENGVGDCLEDDVYSVNEYIMSTYNYVPNSTSIVDHKLYDFAGGMRAENYEDYECWKRVSRYTKIMFINKPLVFYDINHGGMVTYYRYV